MKNALTTAAILSLGLVSFDVSSQETESSDEVTPSTRPIEEISVTGQRSLSRLRLRRLASTDEHDTTSTHTTTRVSLFWQQQLAS